MENLKCFELDKNIKDHLIGNVENPLKKHPAKIKRVKEQN